MVVDREENDARELVRSLRTAPSGVRTAALQHLEQRARDSGGNPAAWNLYALALGEVGRSGEAAEILERVVAAAPAVAIYRVSLATMYSNARQFERCRYHLEHLAVHGVTQADRDLANQQLDGMRAFHREAGDEQELLDTQTEALRERVRCNAASAQDFVALGRLLLRNRPRDDESLLPEAIAVLDYGRSVHPASVPILEHLILGLLRYDPDNRLDAAVLELESVAPDSPALAALRRITDDDVATHEQEMETRVQGLMGAAFGEEPRLREIAVNELGNLVAAFPQNPHYRCAFALALSVNDRHADALTQARRVDEYGQLSHSHHFNLGQVFDFVGEPESAERHFQLALETASTEQERADALEMLHRKRGAG